MCMRITRKYILSIILIVLSSIILTCNPYVDKPEISFLESTTIDAFEGDSIVIKAKPNIGANKIKLYFVSTR